MVTVRDLKISLSIRDTSFKREMKSINTAASSFNRNLIRSNESLNVLQQTIDGFNGANIPNQISINVDKKSLANELSSVVKSFANNGPLLDLKISGATLKNSIEDWINKNLDKGHFIKHIPLVLQWDPLKDSINDFLDTSKDKGVKHLPLELDTKTLLDSINKFKGQIPLELEWKPLKDSINVFLDRVRTKDIKSVEKLPLEIDWKFLRDSINEFLEGVAKGKKGIIPLKLTQDLQQDKQAESGKDEKKPETMESIAKALGIMVGEQNKTNVLLKEISNKTGTINWGSLVG